MGRDDGLETRRWNGTKSAFADCTSRMGAGSRNPRAGEGCALRRRERPRTRNELPNREKPALN